MEIIFANEGQKTSWNDFLIENNGSFVQSFGWGEFQEYFQKNVLRLEARSRSNNVLAQAQIIQKVFPLRIKSYFYIPFGPVFRNGISLEEKEKAFGLMLNKIKDISRTEKAFFLRIEPIFPLPKNFNFCVSGKRVQPQKTLILDLEKSEEEIFKSFTYRVRYNINLSRRKGVEIIRCRMPDIKRHAEFMEGFYQLMRKTGERDKFKFYSKEHYKKILEFLDSDLFLAVSEGKIIAGNIMVYFGKMATCLHGASDYKYRKIKAPQLLQWEQMRAAKKRGCLKYDFWGIDERKWPGLTFFKKSFGGEELRYPQGKDFVFQPGWYKIYKAVKNIL